MTSRLTFCGLCLALALVCFSTAAPAHNRSISYSAWEIDGTRARVTVRIADLDLSRLPLMAAETDERDRALAAYLTQHLQLFAGAVACTVTGKPQSIAAAPGRTVYEWQLLCPAADDLRIRSDLLFDVAPSHLHFARVRRGSSPPLERVLSDAERTWRLLDAASPHAAEEQGTSFVGYVLLGIEHIVTGYDHLAFLLALLLMQTSLREVAKVVTGFTVAHSITLGLATLGYVHPQAVAIEALIGLSIALVAIENVWLTSGRNRWLPWLIGGALACMAAAAARGYGRIPGITLAGLALFSVCYFGLLERAARPAPLRWTIAFIFGLVHGFGFAAVLLEADLSSVRLAQALFGFNVGVEIGQLAAVVMIWPLLHFVARPGRERVRAAVVEFGSAAVCGLGLFWFVVRAYAS
jgi:HupE / UreJ protein